MNISELSIRNHVFTWMLMFGLIFFGALAYREMGVSLNPDVDFPVANISVSHPGAAPEVIEKDVIEPLEAAVVAVPSIKTLTSDIRTGSGNTSVEFELGQDIDIANPEQQARNSPAKQCQQPMAPLCLHMWHPCPCPRPAASHLRLAQRLGLLCLLRLQHQPLVQCGRRQGRLCPPLRRLQVLL